MIAKLCKTLLEKTNGELSPGSYLSRDKLWMPSRQVKDALKKYSLKNACPSTPKEEMPVSTCKEEEMQVYRSTTVTRIRSPEKYFSMHDVVIRQNLPVSTNCQMYATLIQRNVKIRIEREKYGIEVMDTSLDIQCKYIHRRFQIYPRRHKQINR